MGIFRRVRDITLAAVNEMLDHVEDPIAMLNQYMRDMENEISEAEVAVARQVAMEKKWAATLTELRDRVAKRERQADLAISTGEDEIARLALSDKLVTEQKVEEYQGIYETAQQQTAKLRDQLQELKEKYYEMRNKRSILMSRANVAQATEKMNQAIINIDSSVAAIGFSRMEERILGMEVRASASSSLRQTFHPFNGMDLERKDEIEKELARLKKQKGLITELEPTQQS
ncbi:MAG TPA: PspA/IM30 family protein [Bacillota bacterium]|nr:PspA/IM30 family protein [Bacillota bacterium]